MRPLIDRRLWAAGFALSAFACAGTGVLVAPDSARTRTHAVALSVEQAITQFAPVLLQETDDPGLDSPCALDAEGSGRLDDDALAATNSLQRRPVYYAEGSEDRSHRYLFYAFYYPADHSRQKGARHVDHLGDLEGALVIVDRAQGEVDAVITEAHGRFYLFEAPREGASMSAGASGQVGLTSDGRPILFSEAGGHGVYAFGHGRWTPRGGTCYPCGTAAVDPARLTCFAPSGCDLRANGTQWETGPSVAIHRLSEIDRFVLPTGWLRGMPRAARHPRFWFGRRMGEAWDSGALLRWPRRLWERLASGPRP